MIMKREVTLEFHDRKPCRLFVLNDGIAIVHGNGEITCRRMASHDMSYGVQELEDCILYFKRYPAIALLSIVAFSIQINSNDHGIPSFFHIQNILQLHNVRY